MLEGLTPIIFVNLSKFFFFKAPFAIPYITILWFLAHMLKTISLTIFPKAANKFLLFYFFVQKVLFLSFLLFNLSYKSKF
jgi:hypothetical protein